MAKSKILWTEQTWNPIVGCSKVSPGCDNCYAERMAARLSAIEVKRFADGKTADFGPYSSVVSGSQSGKFVWFGKTAFVESALEKPLHWKKPRQIFVCSMSDLFHESIPFDWIDKVFAVMALCPQHTFQVLTKRSARMVEYFEKLKQRVYEWDNGEGETEEFLITKLLDDSDSVRVRSACIAWLKTWNARHLGFPLPNLWLGVTVEHPDYKYRIDELRKIPAAIRFLSCEPLLADLGELNLDGIDWVIVGGESGSGARPMHPDQARSLRDQCKAAEVPFFFKQWGEWLPGEVTENFCYKSCGDGKIIAFPANSACHKNTISFDSDDKFSGKVRTWPVGKKKAGRLLDGVEHNEMPGVSK